MKRFLVITIDVEPDCSPNWKYSNPLAFDGVSTGIAKRLQPLFTKYDFPPTYLINNVVLEHTPSCEVLASLSGKYELGTHLHPEFIEPAKTEFDYAGKKGEANCCFLAPEIESAKLHTITALFEQRFGYKPSSFRAGRFSAGTNTIQTLSKLGYKVDTSVTPHVNWNDRTREQPVDFRSAPEQPYFMDDASMLKMNAAGTILQVPVTIGERRTSIIHELKRTYFGVRHNIMSKRPVWLRPVFSDLKTFISLVEEVSAKYRRNENVIFNMMFHNVEVMPGLSPYSRTERDCDAYLRQLEQFFIYCNQNDIHGISLGETYGLFR